MEQPTVVAIGPHQLNKISDTLVTVRYPVDATTVISMQPDGRIELRPEGARGPYEVALLKGDRLVYAPLGTEGDVFLLPFTDAMPNS